MKATLLIAFSLLVFQRYAGGATSQNWSGSSVTITDKANRYELIATYNQALNSKVKNLMDDAIGRANNFSFKNVESDAVLTLNNKMTFYMKSSPGKLVLKFDKRKNSDEFYGQFKQMCEGIKTIIEQDK